MEETIQSKNVSLQAYRQPHGVDRQRGNTETKAVAKHPQTGISRSQRSALLSCVAP